MGYYPHPVEIEYKSATDALLMVFSDGHTSVFPTLYLRGYCPCARCQGHSGGPPDFLSVTEHEQIEVIDVQPVGSYALTITWADGHDTGIYSFQKLREMCPCPECLPQGLPAYQREFGTAPPAP
jgi:DUF971 family protein